MKKFLLFTFLILFVFISVRAQGNLEFNQVLNYEFTSAGSSFTVPAGKVWKLENVMITSTNNYACLVYNGNTYIMRQHNTSSSAWDNFPFWIGSNKTFTLGGGCASGFISIIEFNVIP